MKKHFKNQASILFAAVILAVPAMAQDSSRTTVINSDAKSNTITMQSTKPFAGADQFRTWSVGIHGGVLMPLNGIGGSNDFTKGEPTIGYGGYLKIQMTHAFGLQAEFLKGIVKGNNENDLGNGDRPQSPYSSFKTNLNWAASISSVATIGGINFLNRKNAILPYISLGAGIADYNPTLITTGNTAIDYKADGSIREFFIPVGAGMKARLSKGVNLDLAYRMNFTDGDNFDGYYSGSSKDKFSYGSIGLEFALGNKSEEQLAFNNGAADLEQDLMDQNNALKTSVASSIAANEQNLQQKLTLINGLQDELNKMKKDSDGDGVSDYFDKCPGTASTEKVDGAGCPLPKPEVIKETTTIITEDDKRVLAEAIKDLQFATGKSTILSSSYPSLDRVANLLVEKNFSLKLAGHTDDVGSDAANLKLSKNRAEAVKAYLVKKGANPSRIEATGYGETQPIETNKTNEGRQKNRRVEFSLF